MIDDGRGRSLALVGPGRAGVALARALADAGWRVVGVAGRTPDAPSTRNAAAALAAPALDVDRVARDAALVVVATPDAAIGEVASALAGSLEPGALVVHLAGALGADALDPIVAARGDVHVGAFHPLQTFTRDAPPSVAGAWAAIAGDDVVTDRLAVVAEELGMRPFVVADVWRPVYHAAAAVASNHLVALLGQVERLAVQAGVPLDAFEPLVRSSVQHAFASGPAAALTGPVARGDVATVIRHLEAIEPAERPAYRALADAARRLAGRADPALVEALS